MSLCVCVHISWGPFMAVNSRLKLQEYRDLTLVIFTTTNRIFFLFVIEAQVEIPWFSENKT